MELKEILKCMQSTLCKGKKKRSDQKTSSLTIILKEEGS